MFSVVTGDPREIADEMLVNPDVDLVTFTGGVAVGKYIAAKAVYKRQVLELGGNDPIIVMEDADLDEAALLAATGSYKNSGQRCNRGQADSRAQRRSPMGSSSGCWRVRARGRSATPPIPRWTWAR
jgi:acyl-CoA reductase-like NAD-dependent aldehyde dehydrogenase